VTSPATTENRFPAKIISHADAGNRPKLLPESGRTHVRMFGTLSREIPLGEAEPAAVEDGVATYENLILESRHEPEAATGVSTRICGNLVNTLHLPKYGISTPLS